MAMVSGKITVEFMDIGADGACFDIDDVEQYEGMKTIL
jgi:hypothetical protein